MIKKVLYILSVLKTAIRALALAVILIFAAPELPVAVMLSSLLIIGAGIYLIVKHARSSLRMADLAVYFGGDALIIIFHMAFISFFSAMQVGFWEYLLLGTILDILIDAVLIILALRRGRYVDIKDVMDARNEEKSKK
ncbi:hypothetical protein [Zongyangia hominis]|uniref:Uncharacterized protein n=1 Tax=Zongyangia hominis TaxID=2763677 RepID=A0A926IAW2_9FIRM|nr:hypothetical protein [Zongyangia hominis]MBC8569520.1 hypothetical protein [Zongyangia hominis]